MIGSTEPHSPPPPKNNKPQRMMHGDLVNAITYSAFVPVYMYLFWKDPTQPGAFWVTVSFLICDVCCWLSWLHNSALWSVASALSMSGCIGIMNVMQWPHEGEIVVMNQFVWSLIIYSANTAPCVSLFSLKALTGGCAALTAVYVSVVSPLLTLRDTLPLTVGATTFYLGFHYILCKQTAADGGGEHKKTSLAALFLSAHSASIVLAGCMGYTIASELLQMTQTSGYAREGGSNILKSGSMACLGLLAAGAFREQIDVKVALEHLVEERTREIQKQAQQLQMVELALQASETPIAIAIREGDDEEEKNTVCEATTTATRISKNESCENNNNRTETSRQPSQENTKLLTETSSSHNNNNNSTTTDDDNSNRRHRIIWSNSAFDKLCRIQQPLLQGDADDTTKTKTNHNNRSATETNWLLRALEPALRQAESPQLLQQRQPQAPPPQQQQQNCCRQDSDQDLQEDEQQLPAAVPVSVPESMKLNVGDATYLLDVSPFPITPLDSLNNQKNNNNSSATKLLSSDNTKEEPLEESLQQQKQQVRRRRSSGSSTCGGVCDDNCTSSGSVTCATCLESDVSSQQPILTEQSSLLDSTPQQQQNSVTSTTSAATSSPQQQQQQQTQPPPLVKAQIRYLVVLKDITAQLAKEQAEQEAQKEAMLKQAMRESMETLSHELRTPLQGIMGMTSLILDDSESTMIDCKEAMGMVMVSSRLLLTLINNLLDVRKCDAHMMNEFQLGPLPLASHLMDAANFCRPFASLNTVKLKLHSDLDKASSIRVQSNALRFQQVLVNLVSNAIKYSEAGGVVELSTKIMTFKQAQLLVSQALAVGVKSTDNHQSVSSSTSKHEKNGSSNNNNTMNDDDLVAVISVSDEGPGVPADLAERIFSKFAQASSASTAAAVAAATAARGSPRPAVIGGSTVAQPTGTGLGLNLCMKFVQRMKGNVWVTNNPPPNEKGACFSFYLPVSKSATTTTTTTQDAVKQQQQQQHNSRSTSCNNSSTTNTRNCSNKDDQEDRTSKGSTAREIGGMPERTAAQENPLATAKCINRTTRNYDNNKKNNEIIKTADGLCGMTVGPTQKRSVSYMSALPSFKIGSDEDLRHNVPGSLGSFNFIRTESAASATKVLVVDDTLINLKVLDRMLRRIGVAKVRTVNSGQLALETLEAEFFDLVITDIQMPNMNGVELCQHIRSGSLPAKPIVVGLTADTSDSLQSRCSAVGMSYVMHKPMTMGQIKNFFDELLHDLVPCDVHEASLMSLMTE